VLSKCWIGASVCPSLRAHALNQEAQSLLNFDKLTFLFTMRLLLLLSAVLQYCVCNGFVSPATSRSSFQSTRSATAAALDPVMLEALVKCASEAARKAGVIMVERNGAPIIKSKANAKDLLTEVRALLNTQVLVNARPI
jgi:hypothetical protein